jgi:hypothetical protein
MRTVLLRIVAKGQMFGVWGVSVGLEGGNEREDVIPWVGVYLCSWSRFLKYLGAVLIIIVRIRYMMSFV